MRRPAIQPTASSPRPRSPWNRGSSRQTGGCVARRGWRRYGEILLRIKNQLRTAKQRELAPLFAVGDERIPDLRGAPQVHGSRLAVEPAFLRRVEEIRLELHRGEVLRVRGQVRNASVARERVCEAHDRAGVQIAVRREKRLAQLELPFH